MENDTENQAGGSSSGSEAAKPVNPGTGDQEKTTGSKTTPDQSPKSPGDQEETQESGQDADEAVQGIKFENKHRGGDAHDVEGV